MVSSFDTASAAAVVADAAEVVLRSRAVCLYRCCQRTPVLEVDCLNEYRCQWPYRRFLGRRHRHVPSNWANEDAVDR